MKPVKAGWGRRARCAVLAAGAWLATGAVAQPAATASRPPADDPPPRATAPYRSAGLCAGLPRLALRTPAGWCLALVANASQGLRFPRRVLEVAPQRYWLVDMGGWDRGRGRLLEFTFAPGQATPPVLRVLLDRLDRPHGIARGPDGRIYVGEAGRLWRTRLPAGSEPPVPDVVVEGLPDDGAHPLKELVFAPDGRLFINVGSFSDACRQPDGSQPLPCPETQGPRPRAAVYEARFEGPERRLASLRPYATGLRNSVALAWVPTAAGGVLLQGENSIDLVDPSQPPEELNLLREGSDHGWPGCVGQRRPSPRYAGRVDCSASAAPLALWPAHAAPLQMLAVPASAPAPLAGRLLVAWHGWHATGHRVVAQALKPDGLPRGAAVDLIADWGAKRGQQPQGAPTGIMLDSGGRLWVVEDRHRTLLMLVREDADAR